MLAFLVIAFALAGVPEAPDFQATSGDGISSHDLRRFYQSCAKAANPDLSKSTRENGIVYARRALDDIDEDTERDIAALEAYLEAVEGFLRGEAQAADARAVTVLPAEAFPAVEGPLKAPTVPSFELDEAFSVRAAQLRHFFDNCAVMVSRDLHPNEKQRAYHVDKARGALQSVVDKVAGRQDLSSLREYFAASQAVSAQMEAEAQGVARDAKRFADLARAAWVLPPVDPNSDPSVQLQAIGAWKARVQLLGSPGYAVFRTPASEAGDSDYAYAAIEGRRAFSDYADRTAELLPSVDQRLAQCARYGATETFLCARKEAAYWGMVVDLTGSPEAASARDRAEQAAAAHGSLQAAQATDRKAAAERLARVRMPAPATSDPTAIAAAKQAMASTGWNEPVLAVSVTSAGWTQVRDVLTGSIIARQRTAVIATRQGPDRCMIYDFTIRQPRTRTGFGRAVRWGHDAAEILCSKVGG